MKKHIFSILFKKIFIILAFLWSSLVLYSAILNLEENDRSTIAKASVEAETIFQHNLAYRRWNSSLGGVYAIVSKTNQPNPLIHDEKRDLVTSDGTVLTIINPFQMTRQAYKLLQDQSPKLAVFNRTVSLDPLNPENSPDEWERAALEDFEKGGKARAEMTTIQNAPYMRLISPYIAEQRCMGCHEWQGYAIDDIRGGMSIAIPMEPHLKAAAQNRKLIIQSHLFLWLLGTGIIGLLSQGLKKYQSEIETNKEIFQIVSEFAYNFEYWINEKDKLTFISSSCKRITGYSRKEFLKQKSLMTDMIHPEDKHLFKLSMDSSENTTNENVECRILTKTGHIKWLSHVSVPVYADGNFRGRRGSLIDITDKKKLQEKLLQAKKVEDIGHFAAGVAHDFNNVLTSISTFSQLLAQNINKDNIFARELSNNIGIASRLGQNLTSNLLLFDQKQSTPLKEIKLSRVISNIENILHVLLFGNISLKVIIADNERTVKADYHQIEQILLNLATNGRDAMPDGGTLTISVAPLTITKNQASPAGTFSAGKSMILSVSDTGSGIEKEVLKNIQTPFYSTKSSKKGTGLGLAIVKNIVNQHKALMEVDTALGKGTTFRLIFPSCEVKQQTEDAEIMNIATLQETKNKKTILLVDDDWLIKKSIRNYLTEMGHTVLLAENGEKAISQYKQYRDTICMVILDVILPGIDGKEVHDILKKINPEVKVLFISGSSPEILAGKNICQNTFTVLSKPLEMNNFSMKVTQMMNS